MIHGVNRNSVLSMKVIDAIIDAEHGMPCLLEIAQPAQRRLET